jgi:hypothetical protein
METDFIFVERPGLSDATVQYMIYYRLLHHTEKKDC